MSGPKRGRWRFVHDPIPQYLLDLEGYAGTLNQWVAEQRSFLSRYLGVQAVAQAEAAHRAVVKCIRSRDPARGFEACNSAWATFHGLWLEAVRAREEERRVRESMLAMEAEHAVEDCVRLWEDAENRRLMDRWARPKDRAALEEQLRGLRASSRKASAAAANSWKSGFEKALKEAFSAARENAEKARALVPVAQKKVQELEDPGLGSLEEKERDLLRSRIGRIKSELEEAVASQDVQRIEKLKAGAEALVAEIQARASVAGQRRAARVFAQALSGLGYQVSAERAGEDGSLVIEATAFPFRSVRAEFRRGDQEVQLLVNGEHDSRECVGDMQSLQKVLSEHEMEFTVTDWGRAQPGALLFEDNVIRQGLGRGS